MMGRMESKRGRPPARRLQILQVMHDGEERTYRDLGRILRIKTEKDDHALAEQCRRMVSEGYLSSQKLSGLVVLKIKGHIS